jgi:ribonuclease HI
MRDVKLTADGSCLGNPGPGGWACILQCGGRERVLRGNAGFTTNNRMELTAVVAGLRALTRPCVITVLTDSEYVRRGITEFLPRWRSVGWRNSAGKPVLNRELWEELDKLASQHHVSWVYVRGHSGHPEQERCDRLAIEAARELAPASSHARQAGVPAKDCSSVKPCADRAGFPARYTR